MKPIYTQALTQSSIQSDVNSVTYAEHHATHALTASLARGYQRRFSQGATPLLLGAALVYLLSSSHVQAQTETELTPKRQQFSISQTGEEKKITPVIKGNASTELEANTAGNAVTDASGQSETESQLKLLHKSAELYRLWGQDKAQKSPPKAMSSIPEGSASIPKTLDQGVVAMTRSQKMAAKASVATEVEQSGQQSISLHHYFSIFDVRSRLLEDFDGDSFYRTFSVTFDADVNGLAFNEYANVYAELYVSQEGGPWLHYYTTDVFTIEGNSSYDDYRVLTTLHSGYETAHYDVLIDLYEVGVNDPVVTISSNDSNELYALPLESSDRDKIYVDTHVDTYIEVEAGGSLSWLSLMSLLGLGFMRRFSRY